MLSDAVMSKYETAKILSVRIQQVCNGGKLFVERAEGETIPDAVQRELLELRCPLKLARNMPDGTVRTYRVREMVLRTELLQPSGHHIGDVEESPMAVGQTPESAYRALMKHETDALKIAERIADDKRSEDITAGSIWNTPLSKVFNEFTAFWKSMYDLIMQDKTELAAQRLLTPDGLVSGGIAILIVAILLSLLRI